jgi:hypothetical protein
MVNSNGTNNPLVDCPYKPRIVELVVDHTTAVVIGHTTAIVVDHITAVVVSPHKADVVYHYGCIQLRNTSYLQCAYKTSIRDVYDAHTTGECML